MFFVGKPIKVVDCRYRTEHPLPKVKWRSLTMKLIKGGKP